MSPAVRTGLLLFLAGALSAGGLALLRDYTAPQVAANQHAFEMRVLNEVMPPSFHDNPLTEDVRVVTNAQFLGGDEPRNVYLATRAGQPVGVVIETVAPNGYGGEIALLVGVTADGTLTGVRVTAHRETPGLGDKIELRVSNWVTTFGGRSLANTAEENWTVKKYGGSFDQFTGATVTPRAVVVAVHQALLYFGANRNTLLNIRLNAEPNAEPD